MYIPSIIAFTNTGISMIIRLLTNFFNRIMNDTIQNGKIKIIKFSCTITDSFLGISIVGIKINYHLLTSIYVTSILSYTVLEDDANDEK